jgi:hypothetical protein
VALLIGQMVKMGLPEVLDRPLPRPWTQRGLSGGWTAVRGLASIRTEGAPRTVAVATSRTGMPHTLSRWTAQVLAPLEFRDDRLRPLLTPLRTPASGHPMEPDWQARRLAVSALLQEVSRGEAPTVSGEPAGTADGL